MVQGDWFSSKFKVSFLITFFLIFCVPVVPNYSKIFCNFLCRLKDLTLKDHNILSENAYKHFFSVQTHLVSLTVFDCLNFNLQCALYVLRNCPNLKHLKIKPSYFHQKFTFGQVLFDVIRESSLITFKLIGHPFWDSVNLSQINSNSDVNNSLRYWSSSIPLLELFCLSVVETYHNLTFLELNGQETRGGITDTGLQAIFYRLVNNISRLCA